MATPSPEALIESLADPALRALAEELGVNSKNIEEMKSSKDKFLEANKLFHRETSPFNAKTLVQYHGQRIALQGHGSENIELPEWTCFAHGVGGVMRAGAGQARSTRP